MRIRLIGLLSVLFGMVFICPPMIAQTPGLPAGRVAAVRRPAVVEIDSVEWREDLTRVYCRIIGMPHTSDRIDDVTMNEVYKAQDIDGVDFKRYFQWEDEGVIALEIDFPAVADKCERVTLEFRTVHGDIKASR